MSPEKSSREAPSCARVCVRALVLTLKSMRPVQKSRRLVAFVCIKPCIMKHVVRRGSSGVDLK